MRNKQVVTREAFVDAIKDDIVEFVKEIEEWTKLGWSQFGSIKGARLYFTHWLSRRLGYPLNEPAPF